MITAPASVRRRHLKTILLVLLAIISAPVLLVIFLARLQGGR